MQVPKTESAKTTVTYVYHIPFAQFAEKLGIQGFPKHIACGPYAEDGSMLVELKTESWSFPTGEIHPNAKDYGQQKD